MSFDVKDMYYSISRTDLMRAVDECIESSGSVTFMSASGIAVDTFLELLRFYLDSTYVAFEDDTFLQKSGVCVGSSVAPIFSDIYLAKCDQTINERVDDCVREVFRYVDDYLVVLVISPNGDCDRAASDVFTPF